MFKKKTPEVPRARNRVVQQTPQNTVFSYHASRTANAADARGRHMPSEEKPKRTKQPPKWLRAKNILNALIILIIFLLLVGLSSTPKIIITGDEATKTFVQAPAVYQQAARILFGESSLNGNKLTVNTSIVADKLTKQFPELRTVSISLPVIGRQPTVYIQPATPQLILKSGEAQFMLDSNGRALAKVTAATKLPTGKDALPIVRDQSGLIIRVGEVALPSNSIRFISEVNGQLHAKDIVVSGWTLPAGTSQLDAQIAGTPYFVKYNLRGKAREQAGSFIAVKQRLEGEHATPKEYIDVRVSGRAYYK